MWPERVGVDGTQGRGPGDEGGVTQPAVPFAKRRRLRGGANGWTAHTRWCNRHFRDLFSRCPSRQPHAPFVDPPAWSAVCGAVNSEAGQSARTVRRAWAVQAVPTPINQAGGGARCGWFALWWVCWGDRRSPLKTAALTANPSGADDHAADHDGLDKNPEPGHGGPCCANSSKPFSRWA